MVILLLILSIGYFSIFSKYSCDIILINMKNLTNYQNLKESVKEALVKK